MEGCLDDNCAVVALVFRSEIFVIILNKCVITIILVLLTTMCNSLVPRQLSTKTPSLKSSWKVPLPSSSRPLYGMFALSMTP